MIRLMRSLSGVCVVLLLCAASAAQEGVAGKQKPGKADRRKDKATTRPSPKPRAAKSSTVIPRHVARLAEIAEFDEARKAQLEELVKRQLETEKLWESDFGVKEAALAKQIAELTKEARQIGQTRNKLLAEHRDQLMARFPEEAKQAVARERFADRATYAYQRMDLSKQQREQIKALTDAAYNQVQLSEDPRRAERAAAAELGAQIEAEVFTAEQRRQIRIAALRRALFRGMSPPPPLTKEQEAQLAAKVDEVDRVCQPIRAAMKEAAAKLPAGQARIDQAQAELADYVKTQLLTAEQLKQAEEARKQADEVRDARAKAKQAKANGRR